MVAQLVDIFIWSVVRAEGSEHGKEEEVIGKFLNFVSSMMQSQILFSTLGFIFQVLYDLYLVDFRSVNLWRSISLILFPTFCISISMIIFNIYVFVLNSLYFNIYVFLTFGLCLVYNSHILYSYLT